MEFLNHLDDTALFHKSARHFIDALFERKWRNDIDYHGRGMFHLCFYIQHNALFLNLLKTSTWVYLGIAFIEPSQLYNLEYIDSQLTDVSNIIELVVLCIFGVNFLLEACLLVSMYSYQAVILHRNMGCFKRFFYIIFYENIMSTCILLLDVVFFTDYTLYRLMFPYQFFRFSRLFRPSRHIDDLVKLMFHSVKMRKTIRGFINIIPKVYSR